MNEYIAFMISRETENVHSAKEVVDAFKAITEGGAKPFVTEEELYQVSLFSFIQHFKSTPVLKRSEASRIKSSDQTKMKQDHLI